MPSSVAVLLATRAVEADLAGNATTACVLYTQAADELEKASRISPDEADEMLGKAREYRARVLTLQSRVAQEKMAAMASGAALAQTGAVKVGEVQQAVKQAGGMSTMGAAAAVGATVGFLAMGPVTAVAFAGAAAYATTLSTTTGEIARGTGAAAISAASAAKKFNAEHNITGKLYKAGEATVAKIKEVEKEHQVTTKVSAAVTSAYKSAVDLDQKHHVTSKVGTALSDGLDKFAKAIAPSAAGEATVRGEGGATPLPSAPRFNR